MENNQNLKPSEILSVCIPLKNTFLFYLSLYQKRSHNNVVRHGGSVVKFGALHPEGRRFESHSTRHIETWSKSFTHSCL